VAFRSCIRVPDPWQPDGHPTDASTASLQFRESRSIAVGRRPVCGLAGRADQRRLRSACKPHSVRRVAQVYTVRLRPCLLASAIIHLGGLPETQSERAAPSSLLDLAPGGGCLAVHITVSAGGLLRRLFTMTGPMSPARISFPSNPTRPRCPAVVFCGPIRQISPSRDFPGVVPCGVRTFLDSPNREPRSLGRPEAIG
jgi:hypothetical protein